MKALLEWAILKKATIVLPQNIQYVWGVVAIVAAVSMCLHLVSGDWLVALVGGAAVIITMTLLHIFIKIKAPYTRVPGLVLLWSSVIIFVLLMVLFVFHLNSYLLNMQSYHSDESEKKAEHMHLNPPAIPGSMTKPMTESIIAPAEKTEPVEPIKPVMLPVQGYSYSIGKFEVTNEEYIAFLAGNRQYAPANWQEPDYDNRRRPVTGITWEQACAYCDWLSQRLGEGKYRLPTSKEWLNALNIRGANNPPILSENDWQTVNVGTSMLGNVGSSSWHPACGACDMIGNAAEWCSDGPDGLKYICGGSYLNTSDVLNANFKEGIWFDSKEPYQAGMDIGFRIVRENGQQH